MARPPVLLQLSVPGSSDLVHVVVVHTKSQFTQGLTAKSFRERDPDAMKAAILSRQKLSADIAAYRRHVTHAILSEQAQGVILLGDINDGFTRNTFEKEFLMQSLVDEPRGGFRRQNALLEHVMTQEQLSSTSAYTVVFRDPEKAQKPTKELIDHILVTRNIHDRTIDLKLRRGSAQIGHDVSARHTDNGGDDASTRPSDHMPVWVDFEYR
jgi:endonuclease/exonuclease/phosphatase family metal-dependent hydrolase